jgi:hypothetical protein
LDVDETKEKLMYLLYIDPGTGSMLFSIFIGLAAALYFLFRTFLLKIKSFVFGKKKVLQKYSEYVIYNEANHYWPVFHPVAEEFEERKINLLYLTSSETDPVFEKNYTYVHPEYIGSGNKAFTTLNFLEAAVCLMTTPGLEVYQLKRSKLCRHYSHILHDTGDATFYRLFGIDWYDSVLLSGEYQKKDIIELEKIRNLPQKELIVVGSTYMDDYANKIQQLPTEDPHVFTVLVSPSWGAGALLNALGEKLLDSLNISDWRVIIRPHPQSKKSEAEMLKRLEEKYTSYIWDYKSENIDSLSKADIMISDFSGIIFDYACLFNRPILYHSAAFNKEMYDAGDIENEPWKFEAVKRFGVELSESDLPRIKEIIQNAVIDTDLSVERLKAKETAWQNRGQSGKAVVDALIKINELFPKLG